MKDCGSVWETELDSIVVQQTDSSGRKHSRKKSKALKTGENTSDVYESPKSEVDTLNKIPDKVGT